MIDIEPHLKAITTEARRLRYVLPLDHPIELHDLVSAGVAHSLEFLRFDGTPTPALVRANARQGMLAEVRRWDHGTRKHPIYRYQFDDVAEPTFWLKGQIPTPPIELMIDLLREILRLRMAEALPFVSHILCDDDHEVAARELRMAPCSMKNYIASARRKLQEALSEYAPRPRTSPLERAEALLRRGETVPAVARALHIPPLKLYALQDRIDPTAKSRRAEQAKLMRRGREDIRTEDLVRLRATGMTLQAIGKQLGCSMNLVNKRLKKLGIDTSRIDAWARRSAA